MSTIWNPDVRLVLASGSAARRKLLADAGLPFEIRTPRVDERAIEAALPVGSAPEAVALSLARAKALAACAADPDALCLGADQTLSLEGRLFHKSATTEAALATLEALSGRTHRLTSAFALARGGTILAAEADAAELTLRPLDRRQLQLYLDAGGERALGSVGVYHWEGFGQHLFAHVSGDHSTILGMPMLKLLASLRDLGALRL